MRCGLEFMKNTGKIFKEFDGLIKEVCALMDECEDGTESLSAPRLL